MTFAEALQALENRQETRIELGLDRFRRHLKTLGDPHKTWPSLHVAGTNGKGSVCAILASLLHAGGFTTGLYTSPHLESARERIQVNGEPIPEKDFADLLEKALSAESGGSLTFFELATSIAFQYFARRRAQIAVLETGLGGRLDATNVVDSLASIITSIGLDHTQYLGPTLSHIAAEKAGVIKKGLPVFCPELKPEALRVIERAAEGLAAPLAVVRRVWKRKSIDWLANQQILESPDGREFTLSLLGEGQARNTALAEAALKSIAHRFPLSAKSWRQGLASVSWPGRCEVRAWGDKILILDGAHNPEAMEHLKETLERSPWKAAEILFILGVLKDKDADAMIKILGPCLRQATATEPASPRALPAAELALKIRRISPKARIKVQVDAGKALQEWANGPKAPPAAVLCGSFYLVAQARRAIRPETRPSTQCVSA